MSYYSEHGQDAWLEEHVFRGRRNGTFVELGAIDGRLFSNTLFFENERDWNGLLIEANPLPFWGMLGSGRRAQKVHAAIAGSYGLAEFTNVAGVTGWSGLTAPMDGRHRARIEEYGGGVERFVVATVPLAAVLAHCGINAIDYLCIDVEGAEIAVLEGIDFDRVPVEIVEVENNFGEAEVEPLMLARGYRKIARLAINDIYQRG